MTNEESRPLLQYLFEHSVRPEFTCRFVWRAGFARPVGQPVRDAQPDQRLRRPHPGDAPHHARGRRTPLTRTEVTWPTHSRDGPRHARDRVRRRRGGRRRRSAHRLRRRCAAWSTMPRARLIASGIERGDRVAVWAPNSLEWIVAALGVTTAGGGARADQHAVPRHGGGVRARAQRRARRCSPCAGSSTPTIPRCSRAPGVPLPALEQTILLAGEPDGASIGWDEFVARGTVGDRPPISTRASRRSVPTIRATSSSRRARPGSPKGVVMTHGQTLRAYLDWCDWADLRPGDRYLIANPFFHIFGYKAGCLACLMRGATIFPLAVFDAGVVLEIVERERISVLPGPPTIYHSLLDHPDHTSRDISSLRVGVTGAADIPGRAHPARARGASVRAHPHRIRAHRGRNGHREPARRRLRAHRHHRRCAVARVRGSHRDRLGRRRRTGRTGRGRRARRDGDARLSRRPGSDRGRDRRRLAAHRRPRNARRRRLPAHRRAHQGHVHRRRVQRVSGRDREPHAAAPADRAGRGDRSARRAAGRGGEGVRRA